MESLEGKMRGTSSHVNISTKLQRIAEMARSMPDATLTTLAHHIDIDWLREAYRRTRKDGAAGVDGQTAREYEANLEENLQSLLTRVKSGRYKAPPVRRVYIPKADGGERPIGIPTLEDKILQRAVVMLLQAVYEQDFRNCSYGFRPGRSAHDALKVLREQAMKMQGGWILETDVKSFFDSVDHEVLRQILCKRVRDGVIVRLVGKWLKAGVMERGCVYHPETGTPQGGVISPLLANIVLHEAIDVWFEDVVKPRLEGEAVLVRYADDLVIILASESDAKRVQAVLPKRLGRYGLQLHPAKTRLVRFVRPPWHAKPKRGRWNGPWRERPGTFDFLGFTHYWTRSMRGSWVVKQKTARSRHSRMICRISKRCREMMHQPVAEQHRVLVQMLRGFGAYFGIAGNGKSLHQLRYFAERSWHKWLNRRSHKTNITWERMKEILRRYSLRGAHPRPFIQPHSRGKTVL